MKLVIDRNIWLRGEGEEASFLLRQDDQKMCCVGIYLEALGVDRGHLNGANAAHHPGLSEMLPKEAMWLVYQDTMHRWMPSDKACRLYAANDGEQHSLNDPSFDTEEERENYIRDAFATQGVEVEFIN